MKNSELKEMLIIVNWLRYNNLCYFFSKNYAHPEVYCNIVVYFLCRGCDTSVWDGEYLMNDMYSLYFICI